MSIKDKLQELPKNPGCYLMKNVNGEIIYVGKAKNLSNRVKSYFIGTHNVKTTRLVADIVDFEYIITSTEKEAFILEINLIKKHRPKYNIMLMDDKSYPYILITNEKNPRILYTRELNHRGKYFGPYPNVKAARTTFDMLNKIYPLRKCNKLPSKECLYYHINNCLGPCIKKIDSSEYESIVDKITNLLKGNVKEEIKHLKIRMKEYSDNLDYEHALELYNIIKDLEEIGEKQKMIISIIDTDVFNYATKDDYINIQVFHIRQSKVIERKAFTFSILQDPVETFINVVGQFYLSNNNPIPKEIIIPDVDISSVDQTIAERICIPKQGRKMELLNLVLVNVEKELDNQILKSKREYEVTSGAVIELSKILNIPNIQVIEAFDNSNIQGQSAVSAMVTYRNGFKSPKEYRKFKVKTIVGSDDTNTFKEVIKRRYSRLQNENLLFPNLIIMDGGQGQVNAALSSLKELNIKIPVIGLVKDDFHRTDKILYNKQLIDLNKQSGLFKFLFELQEEVHRYAISFHHDTHSKSVINSKLDSIHGIGPVKRKQILSIWGDPDFIDKLTKLNLNDIQIQEIVKIYDLK